LRRRDAPLERRTRSAAESDASLASVSSQIVFATVRAADCSRYSSEPSSAECEEAGQNVVGIFAVTAVLILALAFIAWRLWIVRTSRRSRDFGDDSDLR
jgi:hypothetical protein